MVPRTVTAGPNKPTGRHPEWIRAHTTGTPAFTDTRERLRRLGLHTVCEEAQCPNIGECFAHGTATFMILGRTCTRSCRFCAVEHAAAARLAWPDPEEPGRVAAAVAEMELRHVVITSVTRDDLPDGGASHFAACASAIKAARPNATVEVLVPDFRGDRLSLRVLVESPIDVLNHNIETVPRLYRTVRPGADYWRSLNLIARAAAMRASLLTKSGLMLGLGERPDEVRAVLHDLRESSCSILTLGQYLRPSSNLLPVDRYVSPEEFVEWKREADTMGFSHVESAPLVRSSYHAWRQMEARTRGA